MCTALYNVPLVQDKDNIAVNHSRESMGDYYTCTPLAESIEGAGNKCLTLCIQTTCSLIKHKNWRILEKYSCYRQPLFLSTGESCSMFSNLSIESIWQGSYKISQICLLQSNPKFIIAGIGLTISEILSDRGVKEEDILLYKAYGSMERLLSDTVYIYAVDSNGAAASFIESSKK